VQMPGMDGVEVARRIKVMSPPRLTPIIFVTALDRDRRQVHDGYESGAVDYLFKPLDPDVLRQKVAAFVRLWRDRQAEERRDRQRYADLAEGKLRHGELERERLIRALDVERARLADVFQQAPVAVAVLRGRVAADLTYELVNPRYLEMLPAHRSPLGRRVREVLPEGGERIYAPLQGVLDTGEPFLATDFAMPLDRDGDGVAEEYFFSFVYHPLVESGGAVSGVIGIGTEVTESVRARREAERLQRVAEQARDEGERAHRRTARLQSLTAALAAARTVEDVATVVVAQAVEATGASTGMLALREPNAEDATKCRACASGI